MFIYNYLKDFTLIGFKQMLLSRSTDFVRKVCESIPDLVIPPKILKTFMCYTGSRYFKSTLLYLIEKFEFRSNILDKVPIYSKKIFKAFINKGYKFSNREIIHPCISVSKDLDFIDWVWYNCSLPDNALIQFTAYSNYIAINYLINKGCRFTNKQIQYLLYYSGCYHDIVRKLRIGNMITRGKMYSYVHHAIWLGDVEALTTLFSFGCSFTYEHITFALKKGRYDIFRMLVAYQVERESDPTQDLREIIAKEITFCIREYNMSKEVNKN